MEFIFHRKKSMKYSGHNKLLCELSKYQNTFILLRDCRTTDASILVYKHSPERTGFNMYAENTQQPLTFLALLPCIYLSIMLVKQIEDNIYSNNFMRFVQFSL